MKPASPSLILVGALLLASLAACSQGTPPAEPSTPSTAASTPTPPPSPVVANPVSAQPAPVATAATGLPQLVFFMNPNGAPCQAQDKILQGMAAELQGKVQLVYRKVTVPEDRDAFSKAGIRGLPALVVYDASGGEIARATPGVQNAAQIRTLIAPR